MTDYKLSIVVPIFNKWNFTKACLTDLFKLPTDHQIIIVDNGSSDETQEELSKIVKDNFVYVRSDQNLGFAKGCNLGYSKCESNKIMFLNNDIRVNSNWSTWTQPIIEAIEDDVLVGPTAGFVDPANNFQFRYETSDSSKPHNYMGGWCLSASRATFSKFYIPRTETRAETPTMGYPQIFSEEFGLAYFEDTDMGFRAKKMKISFKIINIPVTHFGKISSGQLNTNALYSKAKQIFINKWNKK